MKRIYSLMMLMALSLLSFAQELPTEEAERAKLIRQLTRDIPLALGKVEGTMPQINILIKKGEKNQAKDMVEEALAQIARIEGFQQQLSQLDETADEETLMLAQVQETKQYLMNKANQLRNAVGLYVVCDAKLFEAEYATFCDELRGELSTLGVAFTENQEEADWTIVIKASPREHNTTQLGKYTTYFAYVDASVTIDKMANKKRIYADATSAKGGHVLGYDNAAREAYKVLAPQLATLIKEQISQ